MRLNPKIIQLVGELLIPLLGYFFWDWSLYFIFLFLVLDLVAEELIVHLKIQKIKSHTRANLQTEWLRQGVLSIGLLILVIVLFHVALFYRDPEFAILEELNKFWSYEEMGIAQGWLLIPLVLMSAYSKYRMEFLLPRAFTNTTAQQIWSHHQNRHVWQLAASTCFGAIYGLNLVDDFWLLITYLIAFVFVTIKRN